MSAGEPVKEEFFDVVNDRDEVVGPQQPGNVGNHDTNIFVGIWHGAVVAAGKLVS